MMNKNPKLTSLDPNQILTHTFEESYDAQRVLVVNPPTINLDGANIQIPKTEIITVEKPYIITQVEYKEIEKPYIITQVEYKEVEKPVLVEKIEYIEKPILVEKIEYREIERPVIVERQAKLHFLIKLLLISQTIIILALLFER